MTGIKINDTMSDNIIIKPSKLTKNTPAQGIFIYKISGSLGVFRGFSVSFNLNEGFYSEKRFELNLKNFR